MLKQRAVVGILITALFVTGVTQLAHGQQASQVGPGATEGGNQRYLAAQGDRYAEAIDVPVFDVKKGGAVTQWLALGPFDSVEPPIYAVDAERSGFVTDFLTSIGGEQGAVLQPDTIVHYTGAQGTAHAFSPRPISAGAKGVVDLKRFYGKGNCAAYMFCYIDSGADQDAFCYAGWNDAIKVWLNGKQVAAQDWGSCVAANAMYPVTLHKGLNLLLVKIDDAGGNRWEFIFEVYPGANKDIHQVPEYRQADMATFLSLELLPQNETGFLLKPGPFPTIVWQHEAPVLLNLGAFPLHTHWYRDVSSEGAPRFRKAREATKPGRYLAIVEGTAPNGTPVRRTLTFYCLGENGKVPIAAVADWTTRLPLWFGDKTALQQNLTVMAGQGTQEMAMILSAFERTQARPALALTDSPKVQNNDAQLALRLHGTARSSGRCRLASPVATEGLAAPTIRPGTPQEAGVRPDATAVIHAYCQKWYEETDLPFAVLVARHGVVVIHEGFGVATDTPMPMASITKTVTGCLFAQFLDQGLMSLDAPLGDYLPGFPTEGDKVITARECFYHTTGLRGQGLLGGVDNVDIDNTVLDALPTLEPGSDVFYTSAGYNLAGCAMEVVANKGIYRLFYENLFEPLGMTCTSIAYPSLGGGCVSTVSDMARLAQLLLNQGAYGDKRFFSAEAYEQLLPRDLEPHYPAIHGAVRGVGLMYMPQPRPGSSNKGDLVLSDRLMGHGAASSAILRIDPLNDLVVVMTRYTAGPDFDARTGGFLAAVDSVLK